MKPKRSIETLICTVRRERVILAGDLAAVYGVETRTLNQAVKRNVRRFPRDFMFQLSKGEFQTLRSQNVIFADGRAAGRRGSKSGPGKHAKYPPYAFTEHGAIMTAMVLNSPQAVVMSVYVVRAFARMRERLAADAVIFRRLAEIDKTLLEHDQALRGIWAKLKPLLAPPAEPPRRRIGFIADDA